MTKHELQEWAKTHGPEEVPPGFENIGGFLVGAVDPPTPAAAPASFAVGQKFTMLSSTLKYEITDVTKHYVEIRDQNGKVDRWAMPFAWRKTDAIDGHVALP